MPDDDALLIQFRSLKNSSLTPQKRGRALEALVAQRFRLAHFRVQLDPEAARPRQTDLVAEAAADRYLIEVKWTSSPADVGDVDALRARLRRGAGDASGLLISVSGFTNSAVDDARSGRGEAPILLIDGDELDQVMSRVVDLRGHISFKRDKLRLDGDVVFGSAKKQRLIQGTLGPHIQGSDSHFVSATHALVPHVVAKGGLGGFTFARNLSDPDWTPEPGAAMALHLPLDIDDVAQLIDSFVHLSELGWATPAGHWNIAQSERSWHGTGLAELAKTIESKDQRYAGINEHLHQSEEFVYQDVCADGFYVFGAQLAANATKRVYRCEISMRLSGIPLDLDPISELCRSLGVRESAHFRPLVEPVVETAPLGGLAIEPQYLLVQSDAAEPDPQEREWVSAIFVANPLRAGLDVRPRESLPQPLVEAGFWLCNLGDWHPLSDPRDRYRLRGVSWAWTTTGLAVEARANWDNEVAA